MNASERLRALADAAQAADGLPATLADNLRDFARRCEDDPDLAEQVCMALRGSEQAESSSSRRRGGRRAPGPLNPFDVYIEQGRDALIDRLGNCSVDELKDVIAEHGMDRDRLAMKWKTPQRLIDRIVETVEARAFKGDAFRR